jgi:hypothetical protein
LKAARNGGFSFISNGFRLLPMFIEITKITSFSKKCCQNVATEQAPEQQKAPPPNGEGADLKTGCKNFHKHPSA